MGDNKFISLLGWGIILWFIGYVLGIIFFMFIPHSFIGWAILPFGIVVTFWVLLRKIKTKTFCSYFFIAIMWSITAVLLDYVFIVQLLKPVGGYYKFDVYIYYLLTFLLPIIVGLYKRTLVTGTKK